MRILFINPMIYDLCGTHYCMNMTLGAPSLVGVLNKAGHEAMYVDAEKLQYKPQELRRFLEEYEPDAIGMTVLTLNVPGVKRAIDIARDWNPKVYIALGGPHATAMPEETLALGADSVTRGESEGSVVTLFEKRAKGVLKGSEVNDLDQIPFPDWDNSIPPITTYLGNEPHFATPEACVMWNRGCPHQCVFCSNPIFQGQRERRRSKENICEELEILKSKGVKGVFVYSDELVGMSEGQTKWLIEVCNEITKRDLKFDFKCQGRCSKRAITYELMQAMKEAGFKAVMWGIETASEIVLDNYKKGIDRYDIIHSLGTAHSAGIKNWAFLMVGGIGETEEEFLETEDFIRRLKADGLIDYRQVTVVTPQPGASLWQIAQDNGWMANEDVASCSNRFQHDSVMTMPWATPQQIMEWKHRLESI